MKPYTTPPHPDHSLLKGISAIQVLISLFGIFVLDEVRSTAGVLIALTLAMSLFSREKVPDEREQQLRLKAISYGVVFSLLALSVTHFAGKVFQRIASVPAVSGFEALILVLLISLGLFRYWRWQDGREKIG